MTLPTFRSGIRALVDGVRAYFEEHEITAVVAAGWKVRLDQNNQGPGRANRVVIVPGDLNGKAGKIVQPLERGERLIGDPSHPDGSTRAIADWDRVVTLSIWAYDGDFPNDELAQIIAVETLLELTKRAVDRVAGASVTWGDSAWSPPKERQFGAELLVGLTFSQPLYDEPRERAYPGISITPKDED